MKTKSIFLLAFILAAIFALSLTIYFDLSKKITAAVPSYWGAPGVPCEENWQCGEWSACSEGTQTRSCSDINSCGREATTESQSCACVENWQCTQWTACSGGTQTRSCSDINSCGTAASKPVESQSCTEGGAGEGGPRYCPVTLIGCSEWSPCALGGQSTRQTRTCEYDAPCSSTGKTKETKTRYGTTPNCCGNGLCDSGESSESCSQDCTAQQTQPIPQETVAPLQELTEEPQECIEDWECTLWEESTDGSQKRTCTDLNGCGTSEDKPSTSMQVFQEQAIQDNRGEEIIPKAAPIECEDDWECTEWEGCAEGFNKRTCTDANSCGTNKNKPLENIPCIKEAGSQSAAETDSDDSGRRIKGMLMGAAGAYVLDI